jgi:CubicO group peptidase (beta-lactamase class C family)
MCSRQVDYVAVEIALRRWLKRSRLMVVLLTIILVHYVTAQRTPSSTPQATEANLLAFEQALENLPGNRTLSELMELDNVPGVSIAVINQGAIEWARGYGVVEAGGNQEVTPETLFQAASISKPLTAMATLHFVETGRLDLDSDVNTVTSRIHCKNRHCTTVHDKG